MDPDVTPAPEDGTTGTPPDAAPPTDDLQQQDPVKDGVQQPDPEELPQDIEALRREVQELRSLKGRLGNDKGQLAQRVQELERLIVEGRQQPQQPQQPAKDPEEVRREAIMPTYERLYSVEYDDALRTEIGLAEARATAAGEDFGREERAAAAEAAQQRAARRAWAQAELIHDQRQEAEKSAYERSAAQFAPLVARQDAEQTLAGLNLQGVTTADIDASLRDAFGVGLDALAGDNPQVRRKFVAMAAKALALDRQQAAETKPLPTAKPQKSPVTAPAPGSTPTAAAPAARASVTEPARRAQLARLGFTADELKATDDFVRRQ